MPSGAGGVEIVAALLHAEREFDGAHGALLPEDGVDRGQLVGGLERQVVGVASTDQVGDVDAEVLGGVGHGLILPCRPCGRSHEYIGPLRPVCPAWRRGERNGEGDGSESEGGQGMSSSHGLSATTRCLCCPAAVFAGRACARAVASTTRATARRRARWRCAGWRLRRAGRRRRRRRRRWRAKAVGGGGGRRAGVPSGRSW